MKTTTKNHRGPKKGWMIGAGRRTTESAVRHLLVAIGEDPNREGLKETPARVIRSFGELFAGYTVIIPDLFKKFTVKYEGMVVLRKYPFCSMCEHHMMPFQGVAHVGYIPDGKVVGLSKMGRLVDAFARRLQVQERMTEQIAEAMQQYLLPKGCGCVIVAEHGCMTCRGVNKHGMEMVTDTLLGVFKEDPRTRSEFLMACQGGV